MLTLGFLLLPVILVTGKPLVINDYRIKIKHNVLTKIVPIGEPPAELDLSGLGLEAIAKHAFHNLGNLTSLNLSNNALSHLPYGVFRELQNVKYISLANNSLDLYWKAFSGLDSLKVVDLSNNPVKNYQNMAKYLQDRCDVIRHKGTEDKRVYYAASCYDLSTTTKKTTPVLIDLWSLCTNFSDPFIKVEVEDLPDESATLADKNIKCPSIVSTNDLYLRSVDPNDFQTVRIEVCIESGTLTRLSDVPKESPLPTNCQDVTMGFRQRGSTFRLSYLGIENFAKNWFQVKNISYSNIDLSWNKINRLTSDVLNDLPENIKSVVLLGNKIERLEAGVIENQFIDVLDLSVNKLRDIEAHVFEKMNLKGLRLLANAFTNTSFVRNLPTSLEMLALRQNMISEITANSFSALSNLFYLDFGINQIEEVGSQSLRGLSSLQQLVLSDNKVRTIESGAFQDLGELRSLELDRNRITRMNEGVFSGLRQLLFLTMRYNDLSEITKDTWSGVPDTLRTLDLSFNRIEGMENGSFVNTPKYRLFLDANMIEKIEKGYFDIPTLQLLALEYNSIHVLDKDSFDLPNLQILNLRQNLITRVDKEAFRNVGKVRRLELAGNPFIKDGQHLLCAVRKTVNFVW